MAKKYVLAINPVEKGLVDKTIEAADMYKFSNLSDAKTAQKMLLEWGEHIDEIAIYEINSKNRKCREKKDEDMTEEEACDLLRECGVPFDESGNPLGIGWD